MHFLSMLQANQIYQNLLETGCWKQNVKTETFLGAKNAKQSPSLKGAMPGAMDRSREDLDLNWLQYRSPL